MANKHNQLSDYSPIGLVQERAMEYSKYYFTFIFYKSGISINIAAQFKTSQSGGIGRPACR
jgi:hypothetical protein